MPELSDQSAGRSLRMTSSLLAERMRDGHDQRIHTTRCLDGEILPVSELFIGVGTARSTYRRLSSSPSVCLKSTSLSVSWGGPEPRQWGSGPGTTPLQGTTAVQIRRRHWRDARQPAFRCSPHPR
jgi:hypothetical protein